MPQFTTENVCYLKHGSREIMARVFKPEGSGPFPCYIDLHGGAWNNGDLEDRTGLGEYLGSRGTVMVTLNFRHGPDGYPTTLQDIHYGIRWAKAHAKDLKIDPSQVFIGGASSGGHLAMLVAMRPNDARYAAIPLPAGTPVQDASVRCVIMSWPVINPLSRYRHAKRALQAANPPAWPASIIARQDSYWQSEANMAEGNTVLALERGEPVLTPPAIWFQGQGDTLHDYKDVESDFDGNEPQRFCADYRKAGGSIALEYLEMERHAGHSPDLSQSGDMFDHMVAFVERHVPV